MTVFIFSGSYFNTFYLLLVVLANIFAKEVKNFRDSSIWDKVVYASEAIHVCPEFVPLPVA